MGGGGGTSDEGHEDEESGRGSSGDEGHEGEESGRGGPSDESHEGEESGSAGAGHEGYESMRCSTASRVQWWCAQLEILFTLGNRPAGPIGCHGAKLPIFGRGRPLDE